MIRFARAVIRCRFWVLGGWLLLAVVGAFAAPRATSALSYDFGLPGQPGYETNVDIVALTGSGGANPPLVIVAGDGTTELPAQLGNQLDAALADAAPGARTVSWDQDGALLADGGRTGIVLVYPTPIPGADAYAQALPAVDAVAAGASQQFGVPVVVTGDAALQAEAGSDSGGGVLIETIFGATAALVILLLVFGSALALTPLLIAAASILTTFLLVWGLTQLTEISFIVQFLLSLIGLGVAIDYALLLVTRWREERLGGVESPRAVEIAMATAGRSVLFSGVTVAVSLAALIALPVPFLRSVGFTGLLIPLVSVSAALTLLPAMLYVAGDRLRWPHRGEDRLSRSGRRGARHRRASSTVSPLWERVGGIVVRHRWAAAVLATVALLALAAPLLGLRLGTPSAAAQAAGGGEAAAGVQRLDESGLGLGLVHPVEILTDDPESAIDAVEDLDGVAGVTAPDTWSADGNSVLDVWTTDDTATEEGSAAADTVRQAALDRGDEVGGLPAQDADFLEAVYGNAPWVVAVIVLVTFVLLARALRSIWLPIKALVLNVLSLGAAYGVTVLIWQDGVGTELLFGEQASSAITIWVPIAVFAFLFGLSMDYEVFLLSRIREEYDNGHDTDEATVRGLARTGRLVTSAALILFFAFVSLSTVPTVDVKILATALALGILIDATIVRGVLAPALVAALGHLNWSYPRWALPRRERELAT